MKHLMLTAYCILSSVVCFGSRVKREQSAVSLGEETDVQHVLREVLVSKLLPADLQALNDLDLSLEQPLTGSSVQELPSCVCRNYNCGCCQRIASELLDINSTVCANVTYLPSPVIGLSLTLSLDNRTLINKTVSARNPPSVCAFVPYLKQLAKVCLNFHDLNISNRTLSGCIAIEINLDIVKETFQLGCFRIPLSPHWEPVYVAGMRRTGRKQDRLMFVSLNQDEEKHHLP